MRLESALYTGREGITAHGQAIAVIGDNIANSNTTAYKEARAEFADLLSAGSYGSPADGLPSAGNGVFVQRVRQNFAGATLEPTGRPLDVGIDGNGFFMVGSAADPFYTRAGAFSVNAAGVLVDGNNLPVLGIPEGGTELGALTLSTGQLPGTASTAVTFQGNLNATSALGAPPANPQSFRDLNASAAFFTSTRVFDSLGEAHDIGVYFYRTANSTWTAQAYIDGGDVGQAEGVPVALGAAATLTFNGEGGIDEANRAAAAIAAAPTYANGAGAGAFSIDLSTFTQFASPSATTRNNVDGNSAGNITGYEVTQGGRLEAILDSGGRKVVGTIQLANPANLDGLARVGNTLYRSTDAAGDLQVGAAGSNGLGALQGSSLERSNVDMSNEFVDLVVIQRGYQASSQTINTANQLLRDTLALIR